MISMVMTAIIFTTTIIVMLIVMAPPVASSNRNGCSSSDNRSSKVLFSSLPSISMDLRIVLKQLFSARLCSSSSSSTLLSHRSLSSFSSSASSSASSPLFPSSTEHELAVVLNFSFPNLSPLSFPQTRNKELQQMCDASALYVHLQADTKTADPTVPLGMSLLLPPPSLSSSDAESSARLRSKGCWQIALCLLFPQWPQCSFSSRNVFKEELEMPSVFKNSTDNKKCSNYGNFSLPLFLSQAPHPILIDLSSASSAIPFIWFSRIFSKTRRNEEEQHLFNIDTKKKGGKEMWRLMFAPLSPPLSVSDIFLNRSSLLESVKWLLKDFEMQRLLDVFVGREKDSSAADARKSGGFRIVDLRVEGRRMEETATIDVVEVEVTLRLPVDKMTFGGGESLWKAAAVEEVEGRESERLKKMNNLLERWTRDAISASAFSPQFVQFLKVNGKVMNTDVEGEEVGGKKEENNRNEKLARKKEEKGKEKKEKQKHEEEEYREKEEDCSSNDEKVRGKLLIRSIVSEGFHRRMITQVVLGSPLPPFDLCQSSEMNSCTTTTTTGIGSESFSSNKVDDATPPLFEKSIRRNKFFSESSTPFFPSSPFPPSYCAILLVDFLPSTIFVDPDEVRLANVPSSRSEEGRIGENIVVRLPKMSRLISPLPGEVDIEAPSFLSSPLLVQHLHPLPLGLPTFNAAGSNMSALHLFFDLPIHLRYQSPCDDADEYERNCSSGYASISLAPPLLFHNCTSSPAHRSRGGNNNNSSENNSIKSGSLFIGNSSRTTISIDKDMNSKWKRLPVDVYRFGIKCNSDAFLCIGRSSSDINNDNNDSDDSNSPNSGYSTVPLPLSSEFCDGKDIYWWWPPEDVYLETEDEGHSASLDEDGFFYSFFPYIDAHSSAFATWSIPVGDSRHLMGVVAMSSIVGAVACGVTILLLCKAFDRI